MHDRMSYLDLFDSDRLWVGEVWFDDEFEDDLDEDYLDEFDDGLRDLDGPFRDALSDRYSDIGGEELADTMSSVFASLTPAESFNVAKALAQVGKGATQVFEDPTVRQIAVAALPVAGGAIGTGIGGPVGTAVGASLGTAAGKAMTPAPSPTPAPMPSARPTVAITPPPAAPKPATATPSLPAAAGPKPAAAQGSAAATKALVCSQQPDVLKALLALALGEHGRSEVNGVPVGAVMNMLSAMYAKAAEDADELLYASEVASTDMLDAEALLNADAAAPSERADALYAALIDGENNYLAASGLI